VQRHHPLFPAVPRPASHSDMPAASSTSRGTITRLPRHSHGLRPPRMMDAALRRPRDVHHEYSRTCIRVWLKRPGSIGRAQCVVASIRRSGDAASHRASG
jgi:hypothetical protein